MSSAKIKDYILDKAPASLAYVPDFVSAEEERLLHSRVYSAPRPRWTCLSNRRLQSWGGSPHPKGMVPEDLPDWLTRLIDRVVEFGAFDAAQPPNHVLVNEYLPGQGIMPHHDGPLYLPTVATVSLGGPTSLDFYEPVGEAAGDATDLASRYLGSALLQPRSLVVVSGLMYTRFVHGIAERTVDRPAELRLFNDALVDSSAAEIPRESRLSLTIRRVPKVLAGLNVARLLGRRR